MYNHPLLVISGPRICYLLLSSFPLLFLYLYNRYKTVKRVSGCGRELPGRRGPRRPRGFKMAFAPAAPPMDDAAAKAATLMRQHLMFFSESDKDGNLELSFDEFVSALPETLRVGTSESKLKKYFNLADKDGDGSITMGEVRGALARS